MPRKPATVDDDREPRDEGERQTDIAVPGIYPPDDIMPQAISLLNSGVLFHEGDEFVWRTGHLEHIANLYAGDPETTERNYADDLAVARAYSAETWGKLTSKE